jgi:CubicO group peptidase (beta-lactamase class C family)
MRSLAIYGTASTRVYAGVWLPNPARTKWAVVGPMNAAAYQTWFDAYTQLRFRPAQIDLSDDHAYLALFQDDAVGSWVGRHGMTSEQYQAEFNTQVSQGNMPISVQGGGVDNIRYTAIFAKQDTPIPRTWTVTGAAVANLTQFDQAIKQFMVAENVRAGAFAIVKGGTVRYARGYTWADPGYPDTQPNSLFRLASCSKAFVCAAIQRLVESGKLGLNQPVFPLLGITSAALATQHVDARVNTITVNQLVQHEGGWDSKLSKFDAVFSMRKIALAMGLSGHVAKRDLARYMYGEPLDFAPGTRSAYSNFGYVLLGLVVEQVTGRPFIDYVRAEILGPMGVDDVSVSHTLLKERRPTEVLYDDPNLGKSAWDPHSDALSPFCYGGEGWITEAMDTGGGLITSASSMARFISRHAVWGLGGRMAGAARSGGMAGVASLAVSRTDGVDWAYIFNTRTLSAGALDKLGDALNAVFDKVTL